MKTWSLYTASLVFSLLLLLSCGQEQQSAEQDQKPADNRLRISLVLDTGMEDDKTFNSHILKGAQDAAEAYNFMVTYTSAASELEYESHIEGIVTQKPDLLITAGFRMGDATARVARRHPDTRFAIVDVAFFPGYGCPENVEDCYTPEGKLNNVTSLVFAEDQVAFLAGALAACLSKTNTIASVAGPDLPPVVRFVKGYQNGAKYINPDIQLLNTHIPSFNDPELGAVKAREFIGKDADIIFGVGGSTGNGALLVAKELNIAAIGVDGDQYFSFPEAKEVLVTSASKKIDVAVSQLLADFVRGELEAGVRLASIENGGVGLAPFHDWEEKVSQKCRDIIAQARQELIKDPSITKVK